MCSGWAFLEAIYTGQAVDGELYFVERWTGTVARMKNAKNALRGKAVENL
jgi:hypothetical protein